MVSIPFSYISFVLLISNLILLYFVVYLINLKTSCDRYERSPETIASIIHHKHINISSSLRGRDDQVVQNDRIVESTSFSSSAPTDSPSLHPTSSLSTLSIDDSKFTEDTHPILKAYHSKDRTRFHQYCGTGWQEEFIKIQKENLAKDPPRRLISTSSGQGAADRLIGLLTEFYAAFLFKRALQVIKTGDIVTPIQKALDENDINWTHTDHDDYKYLLPFTMTENNHDNDPVYFANVADGEPLFSPKFDNRHPGEFEKIKGEIPTVIVTSNRGGTYHLLTDSPYSSIFSKYHIDPLYSVYCPFHFLFKPNQATLQLAYNNSIALVEEDYIKIAIQIRVGDEVFGSPNMTKFNDVSLPYYQNFFDCALYLEDTIHAYDPSRKFKWYFMSDSLGLKETAKEKYGEKLVTDTVHRPGHNQGSSHSASLQLVIAELLTLSLCDYFIVSHDSNLGKFGSWLSNNRFQNNTFIEHRENLVKTDQYDNQACKPYTVSSMVNTNAGL